MRYEPFTTRPMTEWPVEFTGRRRRAPFRSTWTQTMEQMHKELRMLSARNVVLELALTDADIRLDGLPRATAHPSHPGVIVSLESKHGPLRYMTDEFSTWQENLRAIVLSLEALRKVDRYGVSRRGEQYRGWTALPAGSAPNPARGEQLIKEHGGVRDAIHATHPDHGGDAKDFIDIQAARDARNRANAN